MQGVTFGLVAAVRGRSPGEMEMQTCGGPASVTRLYEIHDGAARREVQENAHTQP